ncbi:MAG: hypothetical protein LBB73_00530 [Dysgonamonadaceae bacterium]|nr:hypothetical protein [Dysgonamonadaceae bacterium]
MKFLILSVIMLSLLGCSNNDDLFNSDTDNGNTKYSDTITVGYRQEYLAPGNAFSLQFDSLLHDWRAPEGSPVNNDKDVKVRISLDINGQKYQTALSLLDGEQQYAIAQGLRFELLAVEPRPLAEPAADYRIRLAVRECEDAGQYLIDGKFEEARKAIDNWLKETEDWVIPANVHASAYVLEKLTGWLEYHLAVSDAQVLCYDCIKTYPAQSEIIISYSNQSKYEYKTLDIQSGSPMQTGGFHDFDGTRLLLLQVDYTSNRFEAVKDLFFPGKSDEFSVAEKYQSPGDFGFQKLYYKELEQLFFYGTIIWMGRGEILYPKNWNIPQEYPLTAQLDIVVPKNGFEWAGVKEGWQPPSEDVKSVWLSVMPSILAREFLAANPEEKVKVYFYQPSVGVGDPGDWKWIFILRNQFSPTEYSQSFFTIDRHPL